MSVNDNIVWEIAEEISTSATWKKLEELYFIKSLTNCLYLKKKLYNFRMSEGTPIKQHLNEFNSLIIDLNNINIKIENKDQTLIVLYLLPSFYKIFKTNISVDDISNALKLKEF